ncbi:unnamed protein product [Schistosoma rodhaini]|nr:unnamed protein product [Schistosoma rodhaini]
MFSLLAKLFHNFIIKLSYTIYFLHVISFINYTITFNPIVLRDNTRENEIVSKDFLLNYIQSGYKLSLLQSSKGREYFDINENHQLITSRFIDRDKLCLQSRLCCPLEGSTTTITTTSTISSNIGSFEHTNFMNYQYNYLSHTTSRNNIHGLQTQSTYYPNLCSAKIDDTKSLYNPMCTFNLTVSVMTSPSEVPDTHQITIIICDENDHVPQFKVDNEYDEPPFIQIDYSNEKNEHYKHVTENSMNLYFIAFIIVTDPDYNDNNNYHLHSSSSSISSLSNRVNSASLSKTALISCKLETHDEFYSLFESDNYKLNKANEVRYVLQTIKSLDREIGDENRIVISCTDSDIPPKTSTATVVVKIDDQNDCIPEIHVSTLSLTAANIYKTDKFQQRQPKDYIPVQPWSMKRLTYLLETEQDKHKVYNSPIFLAFLANISVYTVYIPENKPSSTLIAHLNATDNDSGENGRVTFEMIESYSFNNLFSKLSYLPQFQHILLNQQTYNDNNHMNDDVIEIHSKQEAFDLFQINATHGDLTTRQLIDREENGIITNEVFILIKATDHGISHQLHSFALIQVIILDENDNPPRIISTGPTFNIEENQPTGTKIGEIAVIDPDIFSFVQLDDIYYPGLLEKQTGDYFGKSSSSFSQIPKQQQQQHQHKGLQVRIDPGHGRRDLPFTLHEIGNGRYFLNTTRPLDRETEEAFQFIIVATDNEPVRTYHDIKNNYPSAYIINNHRYPGHTASLSVIVNVIDVNDNRPEIIFPNPMTSNSTVHRLSYRVYAGHEIISINANDRDADQFNGKFHFEMVQDLKSSDLFTIDRDNGMLKTRRTLTKDDLGEYQVHIIVRDEGQPSLETQLLLRLLIDQSEPQWASNIKNNRNYQFNDFLSSSSSSNQMHSNNHHTLRNNLDLYDRSQHELYTTSNDLLTLPLFKNLDSNVLLFIIIIVILFFILIMIGLCIYLRHKYNFLHFIPDIYDNNKCSCCSTCLLSRRNQSTLSSNIDEKPYLKNLLDHTTVTTTTTTTTTTNITAHCNNNTPIKTMMTTNTATTTTLKYLNHIDYGICTDLLKYKQTNFNLGSLTPVSPICCSHSVVHLPISHNNNNQQQRREHHLITNSRNCRHRENQDFFVDSDVSNALIADNTSSFSNSLSPSHSNYDFNDFSRKHTSYVTNSNHRCWPINPLTVNIPNIVNETNDTMHGSYYHFVPNSFGVEFPNQSKKNFYRGYKPGNGLLHTYNVGEQQQYVPNGRLCYINECNETSNAHLAARNAWDASEFEFRPIKDTINSYQAASFTESGKSDDYVRPQVHSLHRTPIPDNDQYIGNNSSVCYPQLTSHLSVWKSDPYLNQSMHDLIKKQHNKESNRIWTETNFYNKIGSTLDGINLIPEYYGTQLKRSKSTRHTTDKDLISTKLQNKPMPFNSNFNNGEDQSSKQLRMITVHPSSDKNDTITTGCHNNSITTTDNNNDIHCTKTNQMSQYAISFPTVQASFV